MSPAREAWIRAWRRLVELETKHDRRIATATLLAVAYVSGWLVLRLT